MNGSMQLKEVIQAEKNRGLSQMAILRHWLTVPIFSPSEHTLHLLHDAIIIGIDIEWWEWDSELVTELGIGILDPRDISDWRSPWLVLREMVTEHVRIKENAHMINEQSCRGYPDKFAFGKTTFIDQHVATLMLKDLFCRYDEHGNLRPIILLGHAVDNDVKMIKDRFGLDIDDLNVVVASIDTQVLAIEAGLVPPWRKVGLSKLLQTFDLKEEYLHNAGNDIVCTMVGALLMTMPHSPDAYMEFYKHLKMHLCSKSNPKWGIVTFCTRCDSHKHVEEDCKEFIRCIHCYTCVTCIETRFSHDRFKCLEQKRRCSLEYQAYHSSMRYAIPCPSCIQSSKSARHHEDYAYGHTQEECPHKQEDCLCLKDWCDCRVPMTIEDVIEEFDKEYARAKDGSAKYNSAEDSDAKDDGVEDGDVIDCSADDDGLVFV